MNISSLSKVNNKWGWIIILTFNSFVNEYDRPRNRLLLKIKSYGHFQGIIKHVVNRLNLVVKETLTLTVSAHHADNVKIEDLVWDVLLDQINEVDSFHSVYPLFHDRALSLNTVNSVILIVFIISKYDLGPLVGLFEYLGNLSGIVPREHHVDDILVLGNSLSIHSVLLNK